MKNCLVYNESCMVLREANYGGVGCWRVFEIFEVVFIYFFRKNIKLYIMKNMKIVYYIYLFFYYIYFYYIYLFFSEEY